MLPIRHPLSISTRALVFGAFLMVSPSALAAEITFFCAGALRPSMERIFPEFTASTGDRVTATFTAIGAITDRVRKGNVSISPLSLPSNGMILQRKARLTRALGL